MKCSECGEKDAVTRDGLYCKSCLKKKIKRDNPDFGVFNDQRGRKARSSQVLGGCSEMRETNEE